MMSPTTQSASDALTPLRSALADRYVLERELGRGGMATVYLARDLKSDRQVAVKVLRPELAASIGAERFLREIELGAVLQHPNIVSVLDSGQADNSLYYAMPFVDGESLRDRLNRLRQLGIDETIDIARQVAGALQFAHEKGIIHRDIKPENILLSGNHAWVADFGIARAVTIAAGETLTRTGTAVGTPTYMSPEQASGSRDVTPQSDVYSLACTVYEMLAGQPPFTAPTAMAMLARHSLDSVPSLRIVRNSTPEHVEAALMCALAKVPADRFETVADFGEALADPSKPTRTTPVAMPTMRFRSTREFSPRRAAFILVAVLPLLGLMGWGGWRFWSGRATTADAGFDPRSIAVLYFDDQSPKRELQYLADGFTEALINELSQVSALKVISRNGVSPFRGGRVLSDSIARALKVGTIVEGTVAQAGDELRVSVALVNAATGRQIDSETLKRPRQNIFELQDDLAKEVSIFLRRRLGQEIQVQRPTNDTRNPAAWEALQRAKRMVADAEPLLAADDAKAASNQLLIADSALAKLEAMEPKWVVPTVQRGWLAYRQSRLLGGFEKEAYAKWIDDGMTKAERAIALAPNDADALDLRGTLLYWRWLLNLVPEPDASAKLLADAEKDFRRSTELNTVQASAWNSLSHLLIAKSQTAEAKLAADNAYKADPYLTEAYKTVWRLFQTSADLGDGAESRKWCDEGVRRFPRDFRFTECRLWLLTLQGQSPRAADVWTRYDSLVKATPVPMREFYKLKSGMIAALALVRAKMPDSARAVAVRSRGNPESDPARELVYLEAMVRSQLGDRDDAIRLLRTYLAVNPQYRSTLGRDETWWFSPLHEDPRYRALKSGGT